MPAYAGYASGYAPQPASWAPSAWGGTAAYGTKPTVPSPTATAQEAIAGNIGNLGSLYGLGAGLNRFQAQQAASQLAQNLPGYQDLISKSSGNIQSMLSGELPSDVVQTITQGAAERGILTGSPGSPNASAALLRSLGLTSLGLQQTGEQELTAAIGRTPTGGLFQPSSMFVSPEQQQAARAAEALYQAAPDPSAAAAASLGTATGGLAAGLGSVRAPGYTMPTTSFVGAGSYGAPMASTFDWTTPTTTTTTATPTSPYYGGDYTQTPYDYSPYAYGTADPAMAGMIDPYQTGAAGGPTWEDTNALLNQPDLSTLLSDYGG